MSTKSSRETRRQRRQQQQRRQMIRNLLIIAGVVLLIAAGIIYASLRPIGDIVEITPRDLQNANGLTLGDPNAPVVVEAFEDFQCPACLSFTQTVEPQLIASYVDTGQVLFIYRHYPFIGQESSAASNASMCANEQDRFWDYHDILFANQTGENIGAFSNRRLQAFAETLGLNMDNFNACFRENRYDDQIKEDKANGLASQVTGTPTIFVNGQILSSFAYPTIQAAIETALATSP
ncbi:MAG TPA: DsbA family protein [Anaerolineales bacterium]|nr:DsbA family protein [Anaerolineales bacterium]